MDKNANKIYEKALNVLQNQKEYLSYIRAEQAELDYKAQLQYAKEKGEEIGVKKGIKEGKKEGIKEGKKEEKIKMAIKLKKLDFSTEEIAEITGITVEKIRKL